MKYPAIAAIAGAALTMTGCLKNESVTTVNRDGSARIRTVVEMNLAPIMALMGGGQPGAQNPLGDTKTMLTQMVRSMNPMMDAWTEAKAEVTDLGATRLTLEGFVKDFTAGGDLRQMLESSGAPIPVGDLPEMKLLNSTTDSSGNWVITMSGIDEIMSIFEALRKVAVKEGKGGPQEISLTEEEVAAKLQEVRAHYAQFKPMAAMLMKDLVIRSEMVVGGDILECSVFEKKGSSTVTWTFTGEKLLSLVDGIIADDQLPKKVVALANAFSKGAESEEPGKELRKFLTPLLAKVYGGEASPKVVIRPGKPAFDYESEVKKAKENMSPDLRRLLEEASKPETGSIDVPGRSPARTAA